MKKLLPYIVLSLLVAVAYGNTLDHAFQYDDVNQILKKPWVRDTGKISEFLFNPAIRPVVILSFNLNYAISGFEVWSYHIFNILIHIGVVLMLYRLVLLSGKGSVRYGTISPAFKRMAFFAAALFALHPLGTQAVTYISSRSSSLATLFYLITMELFFRGLLGMRESENKLIGKSFLYFGGAATTLLLGVSSKLIIITIPAMIFLYHFYFFSGKSFMDWLKGQARLLLAIGIPFFSYIIYRMMTPEGILPTGKTYMTSDQYLLTQTQVIPFEYFKKMLFPINQSIDVDFPLATDWADWSNYGGIAVLIIFVLIILRTSRAHPWVAFGLAWMGITVLPTSSFVPLHDVAVEHRTYLPLIGFCMAAAGFLEIGIHRMRKVGPGKEIWLLRIAMLVLVLMAGLTVNRNPVWQSDVSLWADAKKKAPRFIRPYSNLGEAYDKLGKYEKAIAEFKAALELNPNYTFALNNLGNVYGKLKQFELAKGYFERVVKLDPNYAPAFYNLGRVQQVLRQIDDALHSYRRAFELKPHFEEALYNYSLLAIQAGQPDKAVEPLQKYIAYYPGNYQGYFGLGNAYLVLRRFDDAIAQFRKTGEIKPDYPLAFINLALAQLQSGKIDDAIVTYNNLLKKSPAIAGVHLNLGLIYSKHRPDNKKALFHFQESLRLDPGQPQAVIIQNAIEELKNASLPVP
ncbi:MAG: tetratricopeptide repeat protein [Candidatus Nitronauta litoralis]|uniref:Tetratricopeptide repeat protein n=1 Tax=Candidatus Nitronauta litoralis TaxID=2705533 RepID=A0A7T0FZW9_9BACT|nr:MAG: tetratricopeptide repeat protein [Candidatus Nitronauta litoralis]